MSVRDDESQVGRHDDARLGLLYLDDVGNRTQRVDQQGTHTYAYDDLYRLTSVTYPGPSTTTYAFDAFGNRTSMTDASGTTDYTYDDADRLNLGGPAVRRPR